MEEEQEIVHTRGTETFPLIVSERLNQSSVQSMRIREKMIEEMAKSDEIVFKTPLNHAVVAALP